MADAGGPGVRHHRHAGQALFYCPTRRARRQVVQNIAVTDYAGNGGSYGHWDSLTTPTNSLDGPLVPTGQPRVTFAKITDGTSNTLLVGEKWIYFQWYNDRTSGDGSCIDNEGWCNGWDNDGIAFSGIQTTYYTPTATAQRDPVAQRQQCAAAPGFADVRLGLRLDLRLGPQQQLPVRLL